MMPRVERFADAVVDAAEMDQLDLVPEECERPRAAV